MSAFYFKLRRYCMVIGNIRFNAVSMVNLVMAVGLAVDYTLHFCHAFIATPGSGVVGDPGRVMRVKQTMLTMGSSILKGGGTTLIGTLPLVGSDESCSPRHPPHLRPSTLDSRVPFI